MHLTLLDWAIIALYAAVVLAIGLVRAADSNERGLLFGRTAAALAVYRRLALCREHLHGAHRGPGRQRVRQRTGLGRVRVDRRVLPGAADRALSCPSTCGNRIYTVPEFLERRFSPSVRLTFSAFMVGAGHPGQDLDFAVGLLAWSSLDLLGWDRVGGDLGDRLVTALVHDEGRAQRGGVHRRDPDGRAASSPSILLTAFGLHEVGGWAALRGKLDPAMFSMVRPATDPDLPWPGVFIGVWFPGHVLFLDGPGAGPAGVRRGI